jgi:hypothetical protein
MDNIYSCLAVSHRMRSTEDLVLQLEGGTAAALGEFKLCVEVLGIYIVDCSLLQGEIDNRHGGSVTHDISSNLPCI